MSRFLSLFIICIFSAQVGFGQFQIPEKPKEESLQTSVYDYVNLLSPSEKSTLENKLIRYSDTTSTQIVVAIISSTEGENINFLGAQWGQEWGIGQEKEDNGVLILLAKDDRQIAINTGYGVEHLLTDALSKRIIENVILPEFRQGRYYEGLNRGADVIFQVLTGEYKGTRQEDSNAPSYGSLIFLFFIFILIMYFLSRRGGRGGGKGGNRGRGSGMDLMDIIVLSSLGRGGFGGGSGGFGGGGGSFGGGGGGFGGGFGGGGFGGGGASGGW